MTVPAKVFPPRLRRLDDGVARVLRDGNAYGSARTTEVDDIVGHTVVIEGHGRSNTAAGGSGGAAPPKATTSSSDTASSPIVPKSKNTMARS